MKNILYFVYAFLFKIYSIFPINENKTTFIGTHDMSINGNIFSMYKKVMEQNKDAICYFITRNNKNNIFMKVYFAFSLLFVSSYQLATSKYIFLDNTFLPMAYIRFKPEAKVVQLWHGCNTIKKFGQMSNVGKLKKLERMIADKYTHVMVSSSKMIKLHSNAFGIDEKKIFPLGLPNMDVFYDEERIKQEKRIFFDQYEYLKNKTIIVYAPTFRDNSSSFDDNMNLLEVIDRLPESYVLLNRFHPHVSKTYSKIQGNRMIDMSAYEDLNRLLIVADILISDYSSIVFNYAILNKPIIFYAYDKEEYETHIRGFYGKYENIAKQYAKSKKELIDFIKNIQDKGVVLDSNKWIDHKDNKSAHRIYKEIYKIKRPSS